MTDRTVRVLASHASARIIQHQLTRRGFLTAGAIAGGGVLLTACSPGGATSSPAATGGDLEDKLVIYTWGDYDNPQVIEDFTDELGPTVQLDSFSSNEELIAKLIAANGTGGYDIIVPTGTFIPQLVANELIQPLNRDLIPNIEHVDPNVLGREWDPENEYSICKAWGTTGFVYDTTKITRELTTWSDFLDAAQNEASGQTTLLDDPIELMGAYFWANGIDWMTQDPADLDAAEDFLVNTLAQHIVAFDSYPGSQAIPQSSHVLMQSWNGDARIGILNSAEPDKWQWVLGAPDTELWMDNWCIPTGAPHPEAAHAFINYVLEPEVALQQLDYIGYNTGVAGIQDAAEAAGLERLDMVFFTEEQAATMHTAELTDAQGRYVEIWNAMKAAASQ